MPEKMRCMAGGCLRAGRGGQAGGRTGSGALGYLARRIAVSAVMAWVLAQAATECDASDPAATGHAGEFAPVESTGELAGDAIGADPKADEGGEGGPAQDRRVGDRRERGALDQNEDDCHRQ